MNLNWIISCYESFLVLIYFLFLLSEEVFMLLSEAKWFAILTCFGSSYNHFLVIAMSYCYSHFPAPAPAFPAFSRAGRGPALGWVGFGFGFLTRGD
jgi:hypothetical protein